MKTIRAQATYPTQEIVQFAILEGFQGENTDDAVTFVSQLIHSLITERIARHALDKLAIEKAEEVRAALESKTAQIGQAITVEVIDA